MKVARRRFLACAVAAPAALRGAALSLAAADDPTPWFRKTYRWGQTNIAENDPLRYDIAWWREHWKRTAVQGVIINAGGIVAYYPSKEPLHYRAAYLKERDLYGELVRAARAQGLAVLARMDSNRAREEFYRAHPDWFAVDSASKPYRADDRYVSCVSGPYYEQYLPSLLREIIAWAKPDGFTDNSWSGLDRDSICYCPHCARRFKQFADLELPARKDWQDRAYRRWIEWSYRRRVELWELNNRVTREAGGPHCIWSGMIGGNFVSEARRFRDHREICRRADIILFDDQGRSLDWGFQGNSEMGKRIHGILGWDKLIPESMATYERVPTFRKSANPPAETRMWMLEGIAGMIQPWWHHVGAYQEDRRQFHTAEPVFKWHAANERYLVDRRPLAAAGVVWSQRNVDFHGRDQGEDLVVAPYRGIVQALIRARIPYLPVHVDEIDRDAAGLSVLILPNVACMTEAQAASVRRFAERGGGVLATGQSSLRDEWGDARPDFLLADLLGARASGKRLGTMSGSEHTYLRIAPDAGAEVYGPKAGDEPAKSAPRHAVLRGFEETNILPFGGVLEVVEASRNSVVPLTLVPAFPVYPPEFSWMREPRTTTPGLVLTESSGGGRRAYLAADLDRRFARHNLPDHGNLLANLVRWLARDSIPLSVGGPGLLDCQLYSQPRRVVAHFVNLTSAATWRIPLDELIPVGPLQIKIALPDDVPGRRLQLLVSGGSVPISREGKWARFEIRSVLDHEVAVIE
jgi:hypothetical protein